MSRHVARVASLIVAALLQASTACAQIVHTGPPPPERVELRSSKAAVPMEFFRGLPSVGVRIDGKGPFKFVLDTGAQGSVLTEGLARELGLPDMGHALAGPPGSAAPVPATITRIEELDLGDAQIFGVFAVWLNMSTLFTGTEAPRGVLSASSFPSLLITFDYPAQQVALQRGALPAADGQSVFEWDAAERLPSVPLTINGLQLIGHVDTGSTAGISLPMKFATSLRFASKPVKSAKAKSVSGAMTTLTATLDGSVTVGRYTIHNPRIRLVEGLANANLGSDFLKQFAVTLDSKNRRIRLDAKSGSVAGTRGAERRMNAWTIGGRPCGSTRYRTLQTAKPSSASCTPAWRA
jgi:predicted aspartyl protease